MGFAGRLSDGRAELDHGLREHGPDRVGKALQPVDDGEQDILGAMVAQLVYDPQPKLRALVLLGRLPVTRDLKLDPANLGRHRLTAGAITAVARFIAGQMMIHLGVRSPLGHPRRPQKRSAYPVDGFCAARARTNAAAPLDGFLTAVHSC